MAMKNRIAANILTVVIAFLVFPVHVQAQDNPDSARLVQWQLEGNRFYNVKQYDSAFNCYKQGYDFAAEKKIRYYQAASQCLLFMGYCKYMQGKTGQANQYFLSALGNARNYKEHASIGSTVLRELNLLHNRIGENDVQFNYPTPSSFTEELVYFTIDSVYSQEGNIAKVRINGGAYDGILEGKNQTADVFSNTAERTTDGGDFSGTASLEKISNNKSTATIELNNGLICKKGWQVRCLANVPAKIMSSNLKNEYLYNFNWISNNDYKDIFSRRFLYYYINKYSEDELIALLKEELAFTIVNFAKDTANKTSIISQAIDDGIFKGKNVISAFIESEKQHFRYFFHFMETYYRSYCGITPRFSETYGTWVFNKALLADKDIREYILGDESHSDQMIQRAKLVANQAAGKNIVNQWVDEGLEYADKNFWWDLLSQSRLLYHYGKATGNNNCFGWSDFFDALRFKAFNKMNRCDSFLNAAYENFRLAGSQEGLQWIKSTKTTILDTSSITLNVQSSHSLTYSVFPSPNERYFATAGDDYTIKIWDIQLGKVIRNIQAHNDAVTSMSYNKGGRYLASMSKDNQVNIWNTYNYGLMFSFNTRTEQRDLQFSPDGNYLVSAGLDSTVNFWEPFTGKLARSIKVPNGYARSITFDPRSANNMYLASTDSALYKFDLATGKSERTLKTSSSLLSFFFSNDGKYSCYYRNDGTLSIIDMETGKIPFTADVYMYKKSGRKYFNSGSFSPDARYFIFSGKDSNLIILNLGNWKSLIQYGGMVEQYAFNSNGNYFIKNDGGNPAIVDFSDFDWNRSYNKLYGKDSFAVWKETYFSLTEKRFNFKEMPVLESQFMKDDQSIRFLSFNTNQLNLTNGKMETLLPEQHWMGGVHKYPVHDNLLIYKDFGKNDTMIVYDNSKKEILALLYLPTGQQVSSFAFTRNDSICLITGDKGGIACWDLVKGKMLYGFEDITGEREALTSVNIQPGSTRAIVFGKNTRPIVIRLANGERINTIAIPNPDRMVFTPGKLFFSAKESKLYAVNPEDYNVYPIKFESDNRYITDIGVSDNGKYLYLLDAPWFYRLSAQTYAVLNKSAINNKNLIHMAISHNDSLAAISSMNGAIHLVRTNTGEMISRICFPMDNEAILSDSSGHYLASKRALQSVVFNYNNKSFNYDQFDLLLNQPHKVLGAIGKTDSATLTAYEKAYNKRIRRNGLNTDALSPSKLPMLIILNRTGMRPSTSDQYYTINAKCYDQRGKLKELKVFVNDVPLADSSNEWTSIDTSQKTFDIRIPLTKGNNKVKLYCVNQLGLSSYKEIFDIYCTTKNQAQQTWFIGLGVNEYADTLNNLTYSAKDIRDLAVNFSKLYPGIIIDTLLNKQVTLDNIEKLKERMKKIKVTDRVIMAVTGHGLLSDSLDFYYATYDVDFRKPEKKGLKYEALEELLNRSAARQKLLLIDACHSGMVDKESISWANNKNKPNRNITDPVKIKEARGIILRQKSNLDEVSTFNLMQDMFADFSNENGSVVISAAGGLEYAFESANWHNGVFTYCVLKALTEKAADLKSEGGNGDGNISVQELMHYVSTKVPELTKGRQKPTSRRENIEYDWILK